MIALSTQRPLFLSRTQRRIIAAKRAVSLLCLFTLSAFAAGYFFGG